MMINTITATITPVGLQGPSITQSSELNYYKYGMYIVICMYGSIPHAKTIYRL